MLQDNVQIIVKGEDKKNSIQEWNESDGKINITFSNGKIYSYNKDKVQIKRSALSNDTILKRFEYLKRIAQTNELRDSDGGNILANRYNKIDFVNEDGMLATFLSGKLQMPKQVNKTVAIYPFGFNMSQKVAIDNALENPLSIIEGPPGTGKTQTILNIIANAVMCGKSIAIVSSNNSATANVQEKLEKYQVGFIAAYLGNSENKTAFIESQKPLPDMATWKLSTEFKNATYQSLQNIYTELNAMLVKKNELSQFRQEYDAIKLEYDHFLKDHICDDELSLRCLKPITTSVAALELWFICEKYIMRGRIFRFIMRLINRFSYGITNKEFYLFKPDMMIAICQGRWYMTRISELTASISSLQAELDGFNFDKKMNEYSSLSAQLFQCYLAGKYKDGKRQLFNLDDLWKNSAAFIKEYPVILSTTHSLRTSLSYQVMYDYVIIDESSQVDIVTGALALSCARKAVVVGDLKQLPNVVNSEIARKTDAIFTEFNMPEVYRYKNHSLLLTLVELFPNAPRKLLREHYRCHPKIIEFCNQKFYNNQLIILTEPKKSNYQPLVVYKTVQGNHAREHMNQRQIDMIKNEIIPQQNLADSTVSIGIVTPYRNQTNALQKEFAGTKILADTVDKFQGRENDVIILSTVDNKISEFADNANRLNVAVSRAIEQLIVVVNNDDDMIDKNIGDLVRYVEYNNLKVIHSEVHSIFDYLYSGYRKKRNEILHKQKRISEYDSENLMYGLITEVLEDERFMKFNFATHVPIKRILRDMERLDNNERQYAQNDLTHVDFLVFDKLLKLPRLVIEVDGTAYHKEGSRQAERDKLKNSILDKYGIPYIRFRTDGSNEKKQLVTALNGLILKSGG